MPTIVSFLLQPLHNERPNPTAKTRHNRRWFLMFKVRAFDD
jgi:hypothetical protein